MDALEKRTSIMYIKTHGSPYARKGTPDIIGTVFGLTVVIEFKLKGEAPEPKQDYELEQWRKYGALALVVTEDQYSISETVDKIIFAVFEHATEMCKDYNDC